MKRYRSIWCTLLLVLIAVVAVVPQTARPEVPKNGYVPDEATAVRIAEAVFIPIYGEKQVKSEGPFRARIEGDHWVVWGTLGTLPRSQKRGELIQGGSMTAEINRMTGCIQAVYHMK